MYKTNYTPLLTDKENNIRAEFIAFLKENKVYSKYMKARLKQAEVNQLLPKNIYSAAAEKLLLCFLPHRPGTFIGGAFMWDENPEVNWVDIHADWKKQIVGRYYEL